MNVMMQVMNVNKIASIQKGVSSAGVWMASFYLTTPTADVSNLYFNIL